MYCAMCGRAIQHGATLCPDCAMTYRDPSAGRGPQVAPQWNPRSAALVDRPLTAPCAAGVGAAPGGNRR